MSAGKSDALRRSLAGALTFLEKVLTTPRGDIQRAAAIQAFESTYDLSWKLLQARLREEGVEVSTPRAAFRAAGDAQLIESVERWLDYLDARNLTSHTYSETTAEQVYAVIAGDFAADVRMLLHPELSAPDRPVL